MAGSNEMLIGVRADTSKLTADFAIAQKIAADAGKELRDAVKGGDTAEIASAATKYDDAVRGVTRLRDSLKEARAARDTLNEDKGSGGWLATAHEAFSRLREHMDPLKEGFSKLHERALAFKESLTSTASSIIPHFEAVLGLATVGGAAGFLKMVETTAEWAHGITETTERLGITKTELGSLAKAAKESGIDVEHLVDGMSKFAFKSQEAIDAQKKVVLGIATKTSGNEALGNLPETLRGGTGGSSGIPVLRGSSDEAGKQIDAVGKLIRPATTNLKEFTDTFTAWFNKLTNEGQAPAASVEQWMGKISNALNQGGDAARKIRQELAQVGIELPALTKGEQFERMAAGFTDTFTKMHIGLIKTNGETKSVAESFVDFAKKIEATSSAQERAQLIQKTLGRGYNDLIPTLLKIASAANEAEKAASLSTLSGDLKAHRVDTSQLDKEITKGDELWLSLRKLDIAMKSLQKTFVLPFADVFTPLVETVQKALAENKSKVTEFARGIAASIRPSVEAFQRVLSGEQAPGGLLKFLIDLPGYARTAFTVIQNSLEKILGVLDRVASALNSAFGTSFTGKGILIGLAVAQMAGGFTVLSSGIMLAVAAVKALQLALSLAYLNPITIAITAVALGALLIYENWDKIAPLFQKLWDLIKQIATEIGAGFTSAWNAAATTIKESWGNLTTWIGEKIDQILGFIDKVVAAAQKAASIIASLGGGSAAPSAGTGGGYSGDLGGASGGAGGFASGGYISGPGTGTSDSILARVSTGEHITKAAAVSHYGVGFFHALNNMLVPKFSMGGLVGAFSPSLPSFAGGGLVGGGGSYGTLHLTIGGQTSTLHVANRGGYDDVVRASRSEQRTSAGAKPSWYGS